MNHPKTFSLLAAIAFALFLVTGCSEERPSQQEQPASEEERLQKAMAQWEEKTRKTLEWKRKALAHANRENGEWEYRKADLIKHEGNGDFKGARPWLRKSAEKGYANAQYLLAAYYSPHTAAGAKIGDPDLVECYAWYAVIDYRNTKIRGLPPGNMRELQERLGLSPEQLTEAKALGAEYLEKYGQGQE